MKHGLARGLEREARLFGELAVSPIARRLMEIFFATTALKKDNGTGDPAVKARKVERVGVLGGGLMGSGHRLRDRDAGRAGARAASRTTPPRRRRSGRCAASSTSA